MWHGAQTHVVFLKQQVISITFDHEAGVFVNNFNRVESLYKYFTCQVPIEHVNI
jgi:hypothetical protein